ncbi:MAG: hypothetical protein O7G85_03130 [Planctomycetota bacterium]|nr:hypothetical protein [Planctomycetota bacterium]
MRWILVPLRIIVLIVVLLVAYIAGAAVSGMISTSPPSTTETEQVEEPSDLPSSDNAPEADDAATTDTIQDDLALAAESLLLLMIVLGVCALETIVVAYPMLRSRWGGWKLIVAIMWVFFGVKTFQSQIEGIYFQILPISMSLRIMVMGAVIATIFATLGVLILGKRKADASDMLSVSKTSMNVKQWSLRLGAAAIIYVVIYTVFGHFIAWQSDAVRSYYGSTSDGSGLPGIFTMPTLALLQLARGVLWVALALPIIRMMKGPWWEAALATGLIFAVLMNAQLLLPNPYMPTDVRLVHLLETAPSNFIFGFVLGWLFRRRIGHMTSV